MIFCLTEKKTNSMRGWLNQDHTASWKQKQLCYPKEWMKTYAEIWEITLTKRYSFDRKALTTFTFNRKGWEERGDVLWGIGPPRGQTASGIGDPTGCSSLRVGQAESHLPSNKKKSWKTANAHLSMVLCTCVRGVSSGVLISSSLCMAAPMAPSHHARAGLEVVWNPSLFIHHAAFSSH